MNHLDVSTRQAIETLAASGHSRRAIARKLGINRETVGRHLRRQAAPAAVPNPAISPAGSEVVGDSKPAIVHFGSSAGRKRQCEAYREAILKALERGVGAQRIYQDLGAEAGYTGSYDAVKRFVRKPSARMMPPFRRMECAPGEEAQVDYGQGAWVLRADGTRRRPHILRVVLSHSRKGYTEAMLRQSTEGFIRGLENALHHFGGVVRTFVIDNLRAAVRRCDWFEPELNPKVRDFCAHYGTVIVPTQVATPRHKGKSKPGSSSSRTTPSRADPFPVWPAKTSIGPNGNRRSPTPASTAPPVSRSDGISKRSKSPPGSPCRRYSFRSWRKPAAPSIATATSKSDAPTARISLTTAGRLAR